MNARDSEKLIGILEQIGYVKKETEDADFVIYNTCTVRENANNKVYGRLGYLHSQKKKNPDMMIVVETGSVSEIFTAPKSPEAKSLIIGSGSTAKEMRGRHCIRIVFKENSSYEPVVGNMTLQFKTPVNILYANTKDLNGTAAGEMILQLPEDTEIAGKMVEYLKEKNLYVGEVEQDVFI